MKRLLIPFLLLFFLSSCTEDETYCFECAVSGTDVEAYKTTTCGITQEKADDIERNGTQVSGIKGGYGYKLNRYTLCKKI
jgi:hypothetical protein